MHQTLLNTKQEAHEKGTVLVSKVLCEIALAWVLAMLHGWLFVYFQILHHVWQILWKRNKNLSQATNGVFFFIFFLPSLFKFVIFLSSLPPPLFFFLLLYSSIHLPPSFPPFLPSFLLSFLPYKMYSYNGSFWVKEFRNGSLGLRQQKEAPWHSSDFPSCSLSYLAGKMLSRKEESTSYQDKREVKEEEERK